MFRISWKTRDDKIWYGECMTFEVAKKWLEYFNTKYPGVYWMEALE